MGYLIQLSMFDENMNENLFNRLAEIIGCKKLKVAYISSSTDRTREYYEYSMKIFESIGEFEVDYFDFDEEYDADSNDSIYDYDIIYLSGGPTLKFRNDLAKYGVLKQLKDFYEHGGTIIGMSAGAIMMSESIEIVSAWNHEVTNLMNLPAADIVDYFIVPHWTDVREDLEYIMNLSIDKHVKIYLCMDGSGLIIDKDSTNIEGYGDIKEVMEGELRTFSVS